MSYTESSLVDIMPWFVCILIHQQKKFLPRLCFLTSNASSVANKVFGKRMKILVLKLTCVITFLISVEEKHVETSGKGAFGV